MQSHILDKAEVVWNYHKLNHDIFEDGFATKADGILVFGSSDISVADEAANLCLLLVKDRIDNDLTFPYIIFSGGIGTGPHSGSNLMGWDRTEAEIFSERVQSIITKVLDSAYASQLRMFVECEARNSGQNVAFSKNIIQEANLRSDKLIIVQKPYMERRTYSTFKCKWPNPEIKLYSSKSSLTKYPSISQIPLEEVIGIMLGDLQRIKLYAPPYGNFQIPQIIPDEVWSVFEFLTSDDKILQEYPKFKLNLINS